MSLRHASHPPRQLRRRIMLIVASLGLAMLCAELIAANLLRPDGTYRGRPLPPYRAINNAYQHGLFARRRQVWDSEAAKQEHVIYDQELGWTINPSTKSREKTGTSNQMAARSTREYSTLPEAGIRRVLTFGDSFIYGYAITDAQTFQAQMEASAEDIEVINFGVPSFGSGQALLRFRRCGRELGADTIILGLLLENIGRNVNRYRPIYFPQSGSLGAKPRFIIVAGELTLLPIPYRNEGEMLDAIEDDSILDDLAAHEYWRGKPTIPFGESFASVRLAAGVLSYLQRKPTKLWASPNAEPYKATLAILKAFHDEAMKCGASFAPILIFPTESDLAMLLDGQDKYWRSLLQNLAAADVPFLDLSAALHDHCRSKNGHTDDVFASGHLNPRGNQIVAQTLLAFLADR